MSVDTNGKPLDYEVLWRAEWHRAETLKRELAQVEAIADDYHRTMLSSPDDKEQANAVLRSLNFSGSAENNRLYRELTQARSDLAESKDCLHRQLGHLQGIIDKLPQTADGVPVVPGMELCFLHHVHGIIAFTVRDLRLNGKAWWAGIDAPLGQCYSTYEAAEAAKGSLDAFRDKGKFQSKKVGRRRSNGG